MVNDLWLRLRALFRRKTVEAELEGELRFHLESQVEKYVQSGMSPEEAKRRAQIELGGIEQVKEECREARGTGFLEDTWRDVRYGARMLRKSPGFTIVAVLTLALGIGANTAIFSAIDGILLKPLGYPHPGKLVAIQILIPELARKYPMIPVDAVTYTNWSQHAKLLAGVALAEDDATNLTRAGKPERVNAARVTPNMFSVLGVEPALGHNFSPGDIQPGHGGEAILTWSFWQGAFHGDRGVIGRGIKLDGRLYTVVGVLPAQFHFFKGHELSPYIGFGDDNVQLFVPLNFNRKTLNSRSMSYAAVGRLRPGVQVAQARAELDSILSHEEVASERIRDARTTVLPLREMMVRQSALGLWVLFGTALAVLLIITVNLASLALARAAAREHEGAIRSALGASRGRLLRQSLAEMLLLGIAGGTMGFTMAHWALGAILALAPTNLPRVENVQLNVAVLWFTLAISILAGLLAGALPAWRMAHSPPQDALRTGGERVGQGQARLRSRELLIAAETALSVVLLVAAGLLLASFVNLNNVPMGFSVRHVLWTSLQPSPVKYTKTEQLIEFLREAVGRARALPGVESAAMIDVLPLGGDYDIDPVISPGDPRPPSEQPMANYRLITPDLFRLLRMPLLEGRELTWADAGKAVAVVSASAARAVWPGRDPIGQTFQRMAGGRVTRVVGVVADARNLYLDKAPGLMVYQIGYGYGASGPKLLLRTRLPAATVAPELREAIWKIDPTVPIRQIRSLEDVVSDSLAQRRFETLLTSLLAGAALLLACLGIYGVVSYSALQRTREIGVRMALGAQPADVYRLIFGQGLRPVAMGLVAGIGAALALTRLLSSFLFEISPTDPVAFLCAGTALTLFAMLACYIPARRAMRVDPMTSLRHE